MVILNIDDFTEEKECIFEGERYSVRDNGAIFRHKRSGKRQRPNDEEWTFGKGNTENPYLLISSIRVHRIVATAFHGEPPDPKYVVDHIDSNCRNNRPENLRWLTRLENALKNPVTRKKIEYHCGSIEAFLENPSMLNDLRPDPNFTWMRTVTREEAQNTMQRMQLWANSVKRTDKLKLPFDQRSSFNKRALKPLQKWEAGLAGEPGLDFARTPWCGQYMWGADVHFPCCPEPFGDDPLDDYLRNLKVGTVFAQHDGNVFPDFIVSKAIALKERAAILIICDRSDKNWSIVGITLNKKHHFIHFHLGYFSNLEEAEESLLTKQNPDDFWSAARRLL